MNGESLRIQLSLIAVGFAVLASCEGDDESPDADGDVDTDGDVDSDADADGDTDSDSVTCKSVACAMRGGTCVSAVDCGSGCPDGVNLSSPGCNFCGDDRFRCCGSPEGADCVWGGGECTEGPDCPDGTELWTGTCAEEAQICCVPAC